MTALWRYLAGAAGAVIAVLAALVGWQSWRKRERRERAAAHVADELAARTREAAELKRAEAERQALERVAAVDEAAKPAEGLDDLGEYFRRLRDRADGN